MSFACRKKTPEFNDVWSLQETLYLNTQHHLLHNVLFVSMLGTWGSTLSVVSLVDCQAFCLDLFIHSLFFWSGWEVRFSFLDAWKLVCIVARFFPFLLRTLFLGCHPSISCSLPRSPLSPWHLHLQSEFILSPHQSHGREGAVSSASVSSSLPLSLFHPVHASHHILLLRLSCHRKYFKRTFSLLFFSVPPFLSFVFSSSLCLCLQMVLYLNGLSASLYLALLSCLFENQQPTFRLHFKERVCPILVRKKEAPCGLKSLLLA